MSATTNPDDTRARVLGCLVCDQLYDKNRKLVLEAKHFTGYVSPQYPWAVMLSTNRHGCDGAWSMSADEQAEVGGLIQRLAKAMRDAGSERVYVMNIGEDVPLPHYHLGFFTRYLPISNAVHEVLYARTRETPPGEDETDKLVADIRHELAKLPG